MTYELWQLKQMKSLPLEVKIQKTLIRIRDGRIYLMLHLKYQGYAATS